MLSCSTFIMIPFRFTNEGLVSWVFPSPLFLSISLASLVLLQSQFMLFISVGFSIFLFLSRPILFSFCLKHARPALSIMGDFYRGFEILSMSFAFSLSALLCFRMLLIHDIPYRPSISSFFPAHFSFLSLNPPPLLSFTTSFFVTCIGGFQILVVFNVSSAFVIEIERYPAPNNPTLCFF